MIKTSPFLWNGSSKIQFFTVIWYTFCWRLLRPVDVNFLKIGWWNSNVQTSKKPLDTIIKQKFWSFYPSKPFSFVHFSMILPVVQIPRYSMVFCLFFSKNSLSKSTFYVLSTSPRLVRFFNSMIPWEPKIRTIRGPHLYIWWKDIFNFKELDFIKY